MSEIHSPSEVQKYKTFNHLIKRRWSTSINPPKEPIKTNEDDIIGSGDKDDIIGGDKDDIVRCGDVNVNIKPQPPSPDIENSVNHNGWLLNQRPPYDRSLNAEVQLQQGEEYITGKVMRRALGPDGNIIGKFDNNPYLNSCHV